MTGKQQYKATIFIVDDEALNRDIAARHLKRLGVQTREFPDGQSALAAIADGVPDMMLLDIHMPAMNGLQVLAKAREFASKSEFPILMVTADSNPDSVVEAFELGANDYVTKPIDARTLRVRVDTHLQLSAAMRQIREFAEGAEKIVAEQAVDLQRRNEDLMREISLRMETETQLRQAKRIAEDENRAKSEFLALITHELVTPLHITVGFADLIAAENDSISPAQQRDYARHIANSAKQLLGLVKDMLALVKHDTGRLVVNESEISLVEILKAAVAECRPRPEESGVDIKIDCVGEPEILGDRFLIGRAFTGIISNAVKFSGRGSTCAISASLRDDGGISVRVVDNGIGFDARRLSEMLRPFRQSSEGLARTHQGLGVGLPLSKAVFGLHDATMSIDSAPGKGTSVLIEFPAHRTLSNFVTAPRQRANS